MIENIVQDLKELSRNSAFQKIKTQAEYNLYYPDTHIVKYENRKYQTPSNEQQLCPCQ